MTDPFTEAFAIVVGEEGGFDTTRDDLGNWTGGSVGVGALGGTKYGISAAAYPHVDIRSLTLDDARAIYRRDYWDKVSGDAISPHLAILVFDAAVNNGAARARVWLQVALGVHVDGVLGPQTLAVASRAGDGVCIEFQAQRLMFMSGLSTWAEFKGGWSRRLCGLPYRASAGGAMVGASASVQPAGGPAVPSVVPSAAVTHVQRNPCPVVAPAPVVRPVVPTVDLGPQTEADELMKAANPTVHFTE